MTEAPAPCRHRPASPQSILLVDDDLGAITVLSRMLAEFPDLRFATSGDAALRLARERAPELVLLDAEMPGMSGFDVCRALKADQALAEVPVIFVTAHAEIDAEMTGLALGAVDYITKPAHAPLLVARVKTQLRLKRRTDALRRMATADALTGLANRGSFDRALAQECLRAERSADSVALLMIDIDHFKLFNDRYGHPAGDDCLRAVAGALQGCARRPADLAARYGGEEFVMLLPRTDADGARLVARQVLDAVAALGIPHAASPTAGQLTASIGAACRVPLPAPAELTGSALPQALVNAADEALYDAKRRGRAQFVMAP